MLNVVILNGGRGASSIIPALLARQGLHVTSVVNEYDGLCKPNDDPMTATAQ